MRGVKPKPPELKLLAGERASRINHEAPSTVPGRPECPAYLEAEGREEWHRITDDLAALGVLSRTDRAAITLYCQAFARWAQAERSIQAVGLTILSGQGVAKANPSVVIANDARNFCLRALAEFGCTPSARNRVHSRIGTASGTLRDFLKGEAKA